MKLFRPFIAVGILLFLSQNVQSQTVVSGAEISYKCTSTPGIFEVTLILYRPCDSNPLCSGSCGTACTQPIRIMGIEGVYAQQVFDSLSLQLVAVRDVIMNADCYGKQLKNTCTNMGCVTPGTYTPAYERYEFKGFANLGPTSGIPSGCCAVRFVWDNGIRDSRVQTINPNQSFYTDAMMNRCFSVSPCNNSPASSTDALSTVCSGGSVIINNSVIDDDIDSLSYSFTPALASFNLPVTYLSPYAYNKPLLWSGKPDDDFPNGIRCDPLTGDISFTPTITDNKNFTGTISVICKQWKMINGNYELLGYIRKDFDMIILANCPPNNPPRLITSSLSGSGDLKTNWEICSGEKLCFDVIATDTDFIPPTISDTTYLSWNRSIAKLGATFTPTYNPANRRKQFPLGGPREDHYRFCWTPHDSLVNTVPYYFTISGKDNRCPDAGTTTRSFSVKVNQGMKLTDNLMVLTADSGCGRFEINIQHSNPNFNTFKQLIDIAKYPFDADFKNGYLTYPYTQRMVHQLDSNGKYYFQYRVYDTLNANRGCSPSAVAFGNFNNNYINPTKATIETDAASCSYTNDARIRIGITAGVGPFLLSVNNSSFAPDTIYTNLLAGKHSVRIKDSNGCIKTLPSAEIKATPRVLNEGKLSINKSQFYAGDSVTYEVFPSEWATTGVNWTITNGTALTPKGTSSIMVKWNKGLCSIQAVGHNKGCFDTVQQTFYVSNVGVDELQSLMGLTVSPNPAQHHITITVNRIPDHNILYLYDLRGKLMIKQELKQTQELDLQSLTNGIYILKVGDWYGKIMKQ